MRLILVFTVPSISSQESSLVYISVVWRSFLLICLMLLVLLLIAQLVQFLEKQLRWELLLLLTLGLLRVRVSLSRLLWLGVLVIWCLKVYLHLR
jgi:hypothetical protein